MRLALLLLSVTACAAQIRINAGGPDVTDAGVVWQADKYYSSPSWYTPPEVIPAGVSPIYATKRYGTSFTYQIPVPDGMYSVLLYMIDTTSTAAGQRIFSVSINGAAALADYDLVKDVGANVPAKKSFNTVAVNGTGVKIAFTTKLKSALINAIELLPLPPVQPGPARGKFATISVLDGPDACSPVAMPQSSELQVGGHLCFQPPAPSGLLPFVDFNFGGLSVPLTPADKTFVHGYSLPSPISAGNRYVGVTDPNGNHYALDRITSAFVRIPGPTAAPMWDAVDDDSFYFIGGTQIMRHSMSAGTDTVASNFAGKLTSLSQGGSTHLSSDNWLALWSEPEHTVCAVNLANGTQYCADYLAAETRAAAVPFTFIDFSMITDIDVGTNKRYVVLVAYPSLGVWSVDLAAGKLHFETRGPEFLAAQGFNGYGNPNNDSICDPGEFCLGAPHGDAANINGRQYFLTYADTAGLGPTGSCERDLVAYPLAAGIDMITKRVLIMPMAYCSSAYQWPDFWVGCSPRGTGCVISTVASGVAPYGNQLMFLRDLDHVIKLGFHRSQARGSDSYWWYPRAGISPDGRYIIYDSNLGRPDEGNGMSHEQVFLMRTSSSTAPVQGSLPALAKLEKCVGSGSAWNCDGLWRATVALPDNSVLPLVGAPMATLPSGAGWVPVH